MYTTRAVLIILIHYTILAFFTCGKVIYLYCHPQCHYMFSISSSYVLTYIFPSTQYIFFSFVTRVQSSSSLICNYQNPSPITLCTRKNAAHVTKNWIVHSIICMKIIQYISKWWWLSTIYDSEWVKHADNYFFTWQPCVGELLITVNSYVTGDCLFYSHYLSVKVTL